MEHPYMVHSQKIWLIDCHCIMYYKDHDYTEPKMGILENLKKIADDFHYREQKAKEHLSEAKRAELEAEEERDFSGAMTGIEKRLEGEAMQGKRQYQVFLVKSWSDEKYFHKELGEMMRKSGKGNMFCAWRDKVVSQADVEKYMKGAFRRIMEELKVKGLSPIVNCDTDGGGMWEGFEIVVKW